LRRFRLGDLRKLFRDRCHGSVLPDDDAGREYLKELLLPIWIGPCRAVGRPIITVWGPVERMRHEIERWAPWMQEDEAHELIDEVEQMPMWQRKPRGNTLGERLQLTYSERSRLMIQTIRAHDMTEKAMAVIRKQKKRQRDRLRRLEQGARPQAVSISRTKPWIAAGFNTRRTWERNGKPGVATSRQVNLTTNTGRILATKEELSTDAGECGRVSTPTPAGQVQTCPEFLTADEASWLVDAICPPSLEAAA